MIRNTFERINDGILDSINFTLYEEPLFKIINLPLWRQSDGDLKPAEVWTEALEVVARLRKTRERYRHLEIGRISDNLKKRYTIIDSKERGTDEAQHSMMLVMATVMFMLSMAGGTSTNPHQKIIASIVMMVNDVDGLDREVTVDVGNGTATLSVDTDGSTDNRLTGSILHMSFDNHLLGKCCHRKGESTRKRESPSRHCNLYLLHFLKFLVITICCLKYFGLIYDFISSCLCIHSSMLTLN